MDSGSFSITSLPLLRQGKVRDIYAIGGDKLLIVSTDRLSAYDVILPDSIPGKGAALAAISKFWFDKTDTLIDNHWLADFDLRSVVSADEYERVHQHAMVVRKCAPLPIEAIVRGYIAGSAWGDYQRTGGVCGTPLPEKLREAEKLPQPLYTPSTKAAVGDHDQNISFIETEKILGASVAGCIRDISIALYQFAESHAAQRDIIIADTKFEFGIDSEGKIRLIDEVLTPDSSRFWDGRTYRIGTSPESYDKQIIRDHLRATDWDMTPPGPRLPQEVLDKAQARFVEIVRILTSS